MMSRSNAAPRVRAAQSQDKVQPARSWIHDRAPGLREAASQRYRREKIWAWLSVITLIICWDTSARLDHPVSPPRVRIAHAAEREESGDQKALMPVSARPTVNW